MIGGASQGCAHQRTGEDAETDGVRKQRRHHEPPQPGVTADHHDRDRDGEHPPGLSPLGIALSSARVRSMVGQSVINVPAMVRPTQPSRLAPR